MKTVTIVIGILLAAAPVLAQGDHHQDDGGHHGDGAPMHGAATSPDLGLNDSWEHTFAEAGTYRYHCHPHPFMTGVITVSETDPEARERVEVAIQNFSFEPRAIVVKPGGVVNWTNLDNVTHNMVIEADAAPAADHPATEHAVPAPGLVAGLAVLALAVAVAGRRRRG